MKKAINWKFTIVLLLIGFMISVQYNTLKHPKERDTRDIWAIRQELAEEKKLHSELLTEIRELDRTISSYRSLSESSTGQALKDTVDKLHKKAGTTDITGPGYYNRSPPFRGKHSVWNTNHEYFIRFTDPFRQRSESL